MSVLNPVTKVPVQGVEVEVKQFKALKLLALLKKLNAHINILANEKGELALTTANFSGVVIATEELFCEVVMEATGKDREWLETLDLSEAMDLLSAIFELNKAVLTKKVEGLAGAWKSIPQDETRKPNSPQE